MTYESNATQAEAESTRILVADDDSVSLRVLQKMLEKWGHEVVVAKDGTEAWQVLTAPEMNAHNTFDQPDAVHPAVFHGATLKGNRLDITLPPKSVVVLSVKQAKGLEFDSVLVADPQCILAESPRGAGDLYVAITRATQRLGVVYEGELPSVLTRLSPLAESDPA